MRKKKDKKLKVRIKFNENISEEESNKIWFRFFDMLLSKPNNERNKNRKTS